MAELESTTAADNSTGDTTPQKKRNPIEKIVVWGLILGLAVLAGCEALTRYGHRGSVDQIEAGYREALENKGELLKEPEVVAAVEGFLADGMSDDVAERKALNAFTAEHPEKVKEFTIQDAEAIVWGFPKRSEEKVDDASVVVTYGWKTLLKDYGGVRLRYDTTSNLVRNVTDFNAGDGD